MRYAIWLLALLIATTVASATTTVEYIEYVIYPGETGYGDEFTFEEYLYENYGVVSESEALFNPEVEGIDETPTGNINEIQTIEPEAYENSEDPGADSIDVQTHSMLENIDIILSWGLQPVELPSIDEEYNNILENLYIIDPWY